MDLPPLPIGALDCTACGERLWVLSVRGEAVFLEYRHADLFEAFLQCRELFESIGVGDLLNNPIWSSYKEMDSLDLVELFVEVEEELDTALGRKS
ncbi:MAG TPA: hypothetical protein P5572_20420 [Phycisphaerae bacterium]|nr:hypothetical protein [Phycisphaerae bacterium]